LAFLHLKIQNEDIKTVKKCSHYMQDCPARSLSFWLFVRQCKSIADQRKLLYISWSKPAICVCVW